MSDFFFEIRSGEIPAQTQKPATVDLKRLLDQKFIKDEKKTVAEYVSTLGDVSVVNFSRVTLG